MKHRQRPEWTPIADGCWTALLDLVGGQPFSSQKMSQIPDSVQNLASSNGGLSVVRKIAGQTHDADTPRCPRRAPSAKCTSHLGNLIHALSIGQSVPIGVIYLDKATATGNTATLDMVVTAVLVAALMIERVNA
jgi:hypothetical protein